MVARCDHVCLGCRRWTALCVESLLILPAGHHPTAVTGVLHGQVTLIRLPRPLLLKFELLARTVMLRMKSWDVATFFEDDLAISASHVDAYLSWSSCHHLPTHVTGTGWRFAAADPAGGSRVDLDASGTVSGAAPSRAQSARGPGAPTSGMARGMTSGCASGELDLEACESPPRHGVVFPWAAHRPCEARVPEDWIVGLIQYEHNPHGWFRRPHDSHGASDSDTASGSSRTTNATERDPIDADERFLVSTSPKLNSAYILYQHHGAPFLVTMVGEL